MSLAAVYLDPSKADLVKAATDRLGRGDGVAIGDDESDEDEEIF